ncbi:DUF7007 domain-containing protein [Faunimonas sp. B44]|uniref:DUF7007 domain-containing protein n=1 Tax=Faunimonas sp. B44 TaxID=3461493 RepID=UPI00404506BC
MQFASSPWGKPQDILQLAVGIWQVSTASHGGIKLSADLNRKMPDYMRKKGGWYEEDCEWALVALVFPHAFKPSALRYAEESARNWHPDEYEQFRQVVLQPGESRVKDERAFIERHKNDWVVASAMAVTDGVKCWAKRGDETRTYLVPEDEYRQRAPFGFIIDPTRHRQVA